MRRKRRRRSRRWKEEVKETGEKRKRLRDGVKLVLYLYRLQ